MEEFATYLGMAMQGAPGSTPYVGICAWRKRRISVIMPSIGGEIERIQQTPSRRAENWRNLVTSCFRVGKTER